MLFGFVQTTSSAQLSARLRISLPSKRLASTWKLPEQIEEDDASEEQIEEAKRAARKRRFDHADPTPAL
jgi:hypothetical protein